MFYEYINLSDIFKEKYIRSIQFCHSELNNDGITDKKYRHAQMVQNKFNINKLYIQICRLDYIDLYNVIDVILKFADFQSFTNKIHEKYDLDPGSYKLCYLSHYFHGYLL